MYNMVKIRQKVHTLNSIPTLNKQFLGYTLKLDDESIKKRIIGDSVETSAKVRLSNIIFVSC